MSTSLLYHAFNIRGVEYQATQYLGNCIYLKAEVRTDQGSCPNCDYRDLISKGRKTRIFHMPPLGRKRCRLELIMHRFLCKRCKNLFWPRLNFMDGNKRYTQSFGITASELLQFCTIKDVANYLNVGWDLIKGIHKQKLEITYRNQSFKDLVYLGIDEFSIRKGNKYMTIYKFAEWPYHPCDRRQSS